MNTDTFNVTVKPVPPGGGGLAYYSKPSVDGRRKGSFYINTQNLKAQKKFQATTLTIHEALPGHHLQLSFNKHSPIPSFLRLASIRFPGFRIRAKIPLGFFWQIRNLFLEMFPWIFFIIIKYPRLHYQNPIQFLLFFLKAYKWRLAYISWIHKSC